MKSLLKRSLEGNVPVEMIYLNSEGKLSQRQIRILAISDCYVRAYCYQRKKLRTFRIENILSVGRMRKKSALYA